MQDFREYLDFFLPYLKNRVVSGGLMFETVKNFIVTILVAKRGKHATSFLNTTFLLIITTAFVAGPIIAEKNPLLSNLEGGNIAPPEAVVAFDPFENNLSTVISAKPRSGLEDYPVTSGDTLASIAQKFDISVESIKWANNMKTETIKPGQILKIPPVTGVVHKVVSGDTVYSVAKKYGVDAQAIVNFTFNDFADLETFQLTTGQLLYVPNGVIPEEKPLLAQGNQPNYSFVNQAGGVQGNSNFVWPVVGPYVITTYPAWYHMAADIAKVGGAFPAIVASDGGTVGYASCINWGYGCHVIINHGNGYTSLYGHLSQILVSAGQSVSQGQQIGVMGSTGRSTGPHLHFEIRSGSTALNPCTFVRC